MINVFILHLVGYIFLEDVIEDEKSCPFVNLFKFYAVFFTGYSSVSSFINSIPGFTICTIFFPTHRITSQITRMAKGACHLYIPVINGLSTVPIDSSLLAPAIHDSSCHFFFASDDYIVKPKCYTNGTVRYLISRTFLTSPTGYTLASTHPSNAAIDAR
jgi:hypothetical protein